jgi:hypothetical protein
VQGPDSHFVITGCNYLCREFCKLLPNNFKSLKRCPPSFFIKSIMVVDFCNLDHLTKCGINVTSIL